MGHSTCGAHGSRTCDACDGCPKCRGFRMRWVHCPVKWCATTTLCPDCQEKYGPIDHAACRVSSLAFHAGQERQRAAAVQGQAVITAGVSLPNGNVFAWTSQGNFEVGEGVYQLGLDHPAHVLQVEGAILRSEKYPPEVYGPEIASRLSGQQFVKQIR